MIEQVHPDGSYDVTYDAQVDGKVITEKNVSSDRITILKEEEYWDSSAVEVESPRKSASYRLVSPHLTPSFRDVK